MSNQSNDHGRAYEYVCLNVLNNEISKYRKCKIDKNSSYIAAENAWNSIDELLQGTLAISAISVVDTLFDLEPLIAEKMKIVWNYIYSPILKEKKEMLEISLS